MNATAFEDTLRAFLQREPFQPFVVELLDGRVIEVDQPKVVFGGGAASFFTVSYELVEFACEEVREMRAGVHGATR
jgi:hypothetical protein